MSIQLIAFDRESGGQAYINPQQVGAVLPREGGGSIIRVVGRTEDITVMESPEDVRSALEYDGPAFGPS